MDINALIWFDMANKRVYQMSSGDWLTSDKDSGLGRGTIDFTAPSWTGREARMTIRVVQKENGSMKAVSFKQLGVTVNELSVDRLDFPITGGDKQILVTTNAASLIAKITGDHAPKGTIKAFTTASGLTIEVNDTSLSYGFPGDPGLEGEFQVSLIVHMPDNSNGDEVNENITVNGILVPIYQPGRVIPYIRFEKEFEQIAGTETTVSIDVESNVDEYTFEIVECVEEDVEELHVDKNLVSLPSDGSVQTLNITTKPKDLGWRIQNG